jgi:lysophospholipase
MGTSMQQTQLPEGRVLIIMTGGTICMRESPEGLVPARGFMEAGMATRPSFNDGCKLGMCVYL